MRRRTRVLWSVVAGLVALLVLAMVLLPSLLPGEKIRSIAERRAREATGGEVDLGEVSLSVFPRLELVLGRSTARVDQEGLRGAGLEPGPLVRAEASLERLEVDLALWPLLRRQLEFGEVRLIAPRVTLQTRPAAAADTTGAPAAGEPAATESAAGATGTMGVALAAVEVRDGELQWQEEGTGREVTVRRWRQDLSAPQLDVVMQRLQRLGDPSLPADAREGPVTLRLETRVGEIALAGFGERPLPPLRDLRLAGALTMPEAATEARVTIDELTLAGLAASAAIAWTAERLEVTDLELRGGEALALRGTAGVALPPASGSLSVALAGEADLAGLIPLADPWLPTRPEDAPPWPELSGALELEVAADVPSAPPLDDPAAWQAAWQEGLAGRVEARAMGGPLTVRLPRLGDPLQVGSLTIVSDLSSPRGRTRATVTGLEHAAVRGDASAELVLPPARGPLLVEADVESDLAEAMALAAAATPPRPADAPPLPDLTGTLRAELDVDLASAPSLADSAAWRAAWRAGLDGQAGFEVRGGPVTVAVEQLGDPLRMGRVHLTADLASPRGQTRLEATDVQHDVLQGDAALTITPAGAQDVPVVALSLGTLDLDALAEVARARERAAAGQASAWWSVSTARAAAPPREAIGELIPPDLAADLRADVAVLRFLKTPYSRLSAQGTLRGRVIEVPRLAAAIGSGRITGSATVDYANDPFGRASWRTRVEDAPASALLAPHAPGLAAIWTGALRADLTGACDLADPEAIRNSLTLEGDVAGTDGVIDLRETLGGISRYLGSRQDLLRVVYDGLDQHLRVRDGRVELSGLRVDGTDTDWRGEGWIGLDGAIDMDLTVQLPAGFTPDLGDLSFVAEALRDDQGRIGLDLSLTGQAARPTVGLDVDPAELMKSEELRKGLEDKVKEGLGGLLDRLGGK
jgi:hypothetical protein